jgi:hypothetical protein
VTLRGKRFAGIEVAEFPETPEDSRIVARVTDGRDARYAASTNRPLDLLWVLGLSPEEALPTLLLVGDQVRGFVVGAWPVMQQPFST